MAKPYDRKTPLTAADLLNDRVGPFFEEHGIPLSHVLTDRGTEYCGQLDCHEDELCLSYYATAGAARRSAARRGELTLGWEGRK